MSKPYIYWEINENNFVEFFFEKNNGERKLVAVEDLENVIGDYVDQREDEWVEKVGG